MNGMRSLLQRLLPRGVGTLAGSNLASQLCALAVVPLLTRWCTLIDFGVLQIYLSFTTFAGLIACLRFDYALLQPADGPTAARLGLLALLLALGAGGLTLGLVPLLAWSLQTPGWDEINHLAPVLAGTVAITGMASAATQWLVRTGDFQRIAQARLVQSVSAAALQLGGALAGLGGTGLIIGDAVGRLAGLLLLLPASRLLPQLPTERAGLGALVRLGREYLRFPAIATPSALVNAAGFTLPVLILERYYGTAGLGVYSLLERVMGVPTLFVGQPLSQTFVHRLREALATGSAAARAELHATARTTALLGLLPFGVLAFAGPPLFALVFGERWRDTGSLAQWLAPVYFISYAFWPVMPTLLVLNRLRPQLAWDCARVLALLCLGGIASAGSFPRETMIASIAMLMTGFGVIHYWLCENSIARL